jgi:hypothetical protein
MQWDMLYEVPGFFTIRPVAATATIFSVANYFWWLSEYTITIFLDTDHRHADMVIIFHFDGR